MKILKFIALHDYFTDIFVYEILDNLMYPNNYLDHAVNHSLRNSLDLRPYFPAHLKDNLHQKTIVLRFGIIFQ